MGASRFLIWITHDLLQLDAEGDEATMVVLLILGPLTALAGGVEMPLANPKPLGTLYSVTALVLVISGAAATAVLVAL